MAQKILLRRGGINFINAGSTVAVTAGELLFASGSIVNSTVEHVVFIANGTGNNAFVPVGRLHTGTASPTSFDSRFAGLPYYKTDSNALFRIGTSTALNLSGNISGTTVTSLSGSFSGSFQGQSLGLSGSFLGSFTGQAPALSGSFSGSFQGSGAGLTGIPSTAITAPGTNTQVIFNNAGVLASTARMFVTGSGIGITGTSAVFSSSLLAPSAFSVTNQDGSNVAVNNVSGSGDPMVWFRDRSKNGVTTFIVQNSEPAGSPGITYMTNTYNGTSLFDAFYTGINNSAHPSLPYTAYFWNQTDRAGAHIRFGTRGTERLRIQDDGQVRAFGILRTDTNLQVTGSSVLVGNVTLAGNSQTVTHTGTGNLTISSTAGNVLIEGTTFSGNNVTIPGNLTVQGTTTTIDSTTVNIGDNILVLNAAGASSDGGIQVIDRVSTAGTGSLLWNATSDYWYAGISGSTHYRLATYDSQTPTANSIQKVDANGRLVASTISDDGTTVTISGNITANTITASTGFVATGLTGVIDTSSRVIFRDGSNRLGALATTDSNIEMSTVVGYKADGTLVASSLIDGGTF